TRARDARGDEGRRERKERHARGERGAERREAEPGGGPCRYDPPRSAGEDREAPPPPFGGTQVAKGLKSADYLALLDERATFFGQWGLRGSKKGDGPTYEELVETEGRPRLRAWMDELSTQGILQHAAAVYGYFPVVSEGND